MDKETISISGNNRYRSIVFVTLFLGLVALSMLVYNFLGLDRKISLEGSIKFLGSLINFLPYVISRQPVTLYPKKIVIRKNLYSKQTFYFSEVQKIRLDRKAVPVFSIKLNNGKKKVIALKGDGSKIDTDKMQKKITSHMEFYREAYPFVHTSLWKIKLNNLSISFVLFLLVGAVISDRLILELNDSFDAISPPSGTYKSPIRIIYEAPETKFKFLSKKNTDWQYYSSEGCPPSDSEKRRGCITIDSSSQIVFKRKYKYLQPTFQKLRYVIRKEKTKPQKFSVLDHGKYKVSVECQFDAIDTPQDGITVRYSMTTDTGNDKLPKKLTLNAYFKREHRSRNKLKKLPHSDHSEAPWFFPQSSDNRILFNRYEQQDNLEVATRCSGRYMQSPRTNLIHGRLFCKNVFYENEEDIFHIGDLDLKFRC